MSAKVVEDLKAGLTRLESHIAEDADSDLDRLVEILRSGLSALVRRFFRPAEGLTAAEYMPVHGKALKPGVSEDFKNLRMPDLAVVLGLLGRGDALGHWAITLGTDSTGCSGVIELSPTTPKAKPSKIVVTRDWEATNSLKGTDLWVSEPGDLLVIQATGEEAPTMTRGLGRGIGTGRKSRPARRAIWLSDLALFAADPDELMGAFRAEVSA